MYSPVLGKFLTRDPLVQDGAADVLYGIAWFNKRLRIMRNLYGYVGNRPLVRVDPSGMDFVNGGGFVGVEAQFIVGGGVTGIECINAQGQQCVMLFWKACGGGAATIGVAAGAHNLSGQTCDPDKYKGWFAEFGAGVGIVGGGADIGFNNDPWLDSFPWGASGTIEGGGGIGKGGTRCGIKATWCYYFLIGVRCSLLPEPAPPPPPIETIEDWATRNCVRRCQQEAFQERDMPTNEEFDQCVENCVQSIREGPRR